MTTEVLDELEFNELAEDLGGIVLYRMRSNPARTVETLEGDFAELTGYSPESFRTGDMDYRQLIHPQDQKPVLDRIDEALQEHSSFRIEYRVVNADGETRHVIEKGQAVDDSSVQGLIMDRTPQEKDAIYVKPQPQFEPLINQLDAVVWITDENFERTHYVSPVFEKFWNRSIDNVYDNPQSFFESVHPEDRDEVRTKLLENDIPRDGITLTYRIQPDESSVRWVRDQLFPIEQSKERTNWIARMTLDVTELKETEVELKRKREKLELAVDSTNLGIWDWDVLADQITWNDKALDIFGREVEDYDDFISGVHPEDRSEINESVNNSLETGETYHSVYRFQHADSDEWHWMDAWGQPVVVDGKTVRMIGTVRDVTDKRVIEQSLKESEKRFRQMAEIINEVFWVTDGNMEETKYISASVEEVFGLSRDEIEGDIQKFMDRVHPEDIDTLTESLDHLKQGIAFNEEFRIIQPNGEIRWLWGRGYPIRDESGDVKQLVGVNADITERKQKEKELRTSKRRFQELAEHIDEVFWITDPTDERIHYVSPMFEKVWGRSREAIYENPRLWLETVYEPDREMVEEAWETVSEGGFDIEYRIEHPDEEIRWVHDRGFPVQHDGEVIRIAGVANDITERKKMQRRLQQSEKLAALGEMAASMMHEINNPNTYIQGNADLMLKDWDTLKDQLEPIQEEKIQQISDDFVECLEEILDGSKRIQSIVDRVRKFTHDKHHIKKEPRTIDLISRLKSLVNQHRKSDEHDVELDLIDSPEIEDESLHCEVRCEPGELDEVFENIITNATQALEEQENPKVEVRVTRSDENIRVEISDNGPGVPSDIQEKVFDPFFTTKPTGEGTGLGLSIVKGIVDRAGGEIDHEPDKNDGATFIIRLPRDLSSTRRQAP